jgi:predicted phosphoribosyltransferase
MFTNKWSYGQGLCEFNIEKEVTMIFDAAFTERHDVGQKLAKHLKQYRKNKDTIVLALPRGGVPVAYEVAKALELPMDVYIVRKLGLPGQKEFAMGAIAMDGTIVLNEDVIIGVSKEAISKVMEAEKLELERRNEVYRRNKPMPKLSGKTVVIVDDGVATGATIKAAVSAIRKCNVKKIVVAVPVCPPSTYEELKEMADHVISILKPSMLSSVGQYYQDFSQTTDNEVRALMQKLREN